MCTTFSNSPSGRRLARRPFASVDELRDLLAKPAAERPLLVDARVEKQFLTGHLPGAVNLSARDFNPVEDGVRRLIDRDEAERRLAPFGARELVVYGARGGADAAHLWSTLRVLGRERVWLLDGGIEAWRRERGALRSGPEGTPGGDASHPATEARKGSGSEEGDPRRQGADRLISREELLERLGDGELAIVDTREPEEYRGEMKAGRRGGHIPGAILFPWTAALTNELRLRADAQLRETLAPILEKPEAVVYCQSGVRAAHTVAVLEMLGHPRPRLYLGSWGDWGNHDELPIAGSEEESHAYAAAEEETRK